jgi:hypothetical protein
VIGEDQALIREGIVLVLERAGFEVAGVAGGSVLDPEVVTAMLEGPSSSTSRTSISSSASRPATTTTGACSRSCATSTADPKGTYPSTRREGTQVHCQAPARHRW